MPSSPSRHSNNEASGYPSSHIKGETRISEDYKHDDVNVVNIS